MKVICLSGDGSRRASFSLNPILHLMLPAGIIALLIIGLSVNQMMGLYKLDDTPQQTLLSQNEVGKIITALEGQMETVSEIQKTYANYTVDVDTFSLEACKYISSYKASSLCPFVSSLDLAGLMQSPKSVSQYFLCNIKKQALQCPFKSTRAHMLRR